MKNVHFLAMTVMAGLSLTAPVKAQTLTCPRASVDSPATDAALSKAITKSQVDAATMRNLRAATPALRDSGVSNVTIVDHAIAGYCSILSKDNSMDVQQKRLALSRFAAQATASVYGSAPDDDFIMLTFDVPLALSDRIDVAAAKAGETQATWVRKALEAALPR